MVYIQEGRGKQDHYEERNGRFLKDLTGAFRDEQYNVWIEDTLNEINNRYDAAEEKITELEEIAVKLSMVSRILRCPPKILCPGYTPPT